MAETRTQRQIEANKLDLEVYRAALMVERFAADNAPAVHRSSLEQAARNIHATRSQIRRFMHPKDCERTA